MADIAPQSAAPAPSPAHTPKSKYELKHERRDARHAERAARREARRNDPEHKSRAGDTVGHVSNGLKILTFGHKNPVSEIVGSVSDGLKRGAGEQPNRDELDKAARGKE